MKLPEDFKEFVELLNKHQVKYLVVGGYAVSFHSRPKFTNDIDIWIKNTKTNAQLVLKVLDEFGFSGVDISENDLTKPEMIIQLGNEPIRIDILTTIKGIEFEKAFQNRLSGEYFGVETYFISLKDLVENKRLTGRKKDIQDIEWINKYGK